MGISYVKYYLILLTISIIWIFLGRQFYNNFAPLVFFILGLPVFGYLYFSSLNSFSSLLKIKNQELFKKYRINYGFFQNELISQIDLYNNPDFDTLTDKELNHLIHNIKNSFKYMLLSFFSFATIAVMTIYIK